MQPDMFTTRGLVLHADGRCGAWANLFADVLRAQGIQSATYKEIYTKDIPAGTARGFIVKGALAAQGNAQPPTAFVNHAIVLVGTTIYDPSYGASYAGLSAWEDASLDWLVYRDAFGFDFQLANTLGDEQTRLE